MKKQRIYIAAAVLALILGGMTFSGTHAQSDGTIRTLDAFKVVSSTVISPRNSSNTLRIPALGSTLSPCLYVKDKAGNIATTTCLTSYSGLTTTTANGLYLQVFNVKNYGAVCDGTTDDGPAINSAISAASAAGGGTVYIPPGTCLTATSTVLTSNIRLEGAGPGVSILKGAASNFTVVKTMQTGTSNNVYSNISIRDLTVLSQFGHVVAIYNTTGVDVENSEFYFNVTTPIKESLWVEYAQNVNISGNYLHDLTGNGIQVNATNYFNVSDNIVNGGSNADDLIDIDQDFNDGFNASSNYGTVTGNTLYGGGKGNGIRIEASNYIAVAGNSINHITSAGGGIEVNDDTSGGSTANVTNVTVSGNSISDCLVSGIYIFDSAASSTLSNVSVTGNTVDSCGQDGGSNLRAGILIQAPNVQVSGNHVINTTKTGTDGAGILIYKYGGSSILGNTIASSTMGIRTWNGDSLQSYSGVIISDNNLVGNANDVSFSGVTQGRSGFNASSTILFGAIESGGNLTLSSTYNATKGSILFGNSGYDETNNRLGIGTSTPDSRLQVSGTGQIANFGNNTNSTSYIVISSGASQRSQFGYDAVSGDAVAQSGASKGFRVYVNNDTFASSTPALRINTLGRVGIGTTTPSVLLDVNGSTTIRSILSLPGLGTSGCLNLGSGGLVATTTCAGSPVSTSTLNGLISGAYTIAAGNDTNVTLAVSSSSAPDTVTLTPGWSGQLSTARGGTNQNTWTQGSIHFSSTTSQFGENNTNLFWDNSNLRLGVGTSTPQAQFHLYGTTASPFLIQRTTAANANIQYKNTAGSMFAGINTQGAWAVGTGADLSSTGGVAKFAVASTGFVGVATTTPSANFHVNGSFKLSTASSTIITSSIGGAIVSGGCDSATSTIDQSVSSSTAAFITTPQNDPGNTLGGTWAYSFLSATGVLTTRVCSNVTVTPNTVPYVVKIIQ